MTVEELVKELLKLPEDAIVVTSDMENGYAEPYPHIIKFNHNSNYYDGTKFITLPANKEFVEL